jgi:hypothetical protein
VLHRHEDEGRVADVLEIVDEPVPLIEFKVLGVARLVLGDPHGTVAVVGSRPAIAQNRPEVVDIVTVERQPRSGFQVQVPMRWRSVSATMRVPTSRFSQLRRISARRGSGQSV